jgi:hypothetical protein
MHLGSGHFASMNIKMLNAPSMAAILFYYYYRILQIRNSKIASKPEERHHVEKERSIRDTDMPAMLSIMLFNLPLN